MHACHRTQLASLIDFGDIGGALAPLVGVYGNFRVLVSIWIARITSGANVDGESTLLAHSRARARDRYSGTLSAELLPIERVGMDGRVAEGWALEFIDCRGALSVSLPFIWKQLRYKSRPFLPKWTRCALNSIHISRTSPSEIHIFVKSLD